MTFKTRVRDEAVGGPYPFRWEDKTTADYFAGKRVVLFSLPGAFTPTCSTYQLPGFEKGYADFQAEVLLVMNKLEYDETDVAQITQSTAHIILKGIGLKIPEHCEA